MNEIIYFCIILYYMFILGIKHGWGWCLISFNCDMTNFIMTSTHQTVFAVVFHLNICMVYWKFLLQIIQHQNSSMVSSFQCFELD